MSNGEVEIKKETSVRREDGLWAIVTRAPKVDREVTTIVNFHDGNLAAMTDWTSEKAVQEAALATWRIGFQSNVRRMLEGGKTAEEIQAWADAFKPDETQRTPADPQAQMLQKFTKMDLEQQKAFMAQLKERLASKKAA